MRGTWADHVRREQRQMAAVSKALDEAHLCRWCGEIEIQHKPEFYEGGPGLPQRVDRLKLKVKCFGWRENFEAGDAVPLWKRARCQQKDSSSSPGTSQPQGTGEGRAAIDASVDAEQSAELAAGQLSGSGAQQEEPGDGAGLARGVP
jgi:hypothetical protein